METHIIEQTDQEGNQYNWIAIDEPTAVELWNNGYVDLYFVRHDAEGLIEDIDDLCRAIQCNAVCVDDSYLWHEEYLEGEQNRFRNDDNTTFEEWVQNKIEKLKGY